MNISENARALRRGLLVILSVGTANTSEWEYTKKFRAFFVRNSKSVYGTIKF